MTSSIDSRDSKCATRQCQMRVCRRAIATIVATVMLTLAAPSVHAERKDFISPEVLRKVEAQYGTAARTRLRQFIDFLDRQNPNDSELAKLKSVNDYINRVPFINDRIHWKKEDYWASPVDKFATNGGDCEDFSVAKYFALKKLGVPEEKLRLTYVKSIPLKQAHMVTTYFARPDAIPLVLDNLNPKILPANLRKDLVPVYSFNGGGLWLAKARGTGKRIGGSEKVAEWHDLMNRMSEEERVN